MTTVYGIADQEGYPITDGLTEPEARRVAQDIANRRMEPVWLCEHDVSGDEPWPEGEEIEPRADPVE